MTNHIFHNACCLSKLHFETKEWEHCSYASNVACDYATEGGDLWLRFALSFLRRGLIENAKQVLDMMKDKEPKNTNIEVLEKILESDDVEMQDYISQKYKKKAEVTTEPTALNNLPKDITMVSKAKEKKLSELEMYRREQMKKLRMREDLLKKLLDKVPAEDWKVGVHKDDFKQIADDTDVRIRLNKITWKPPGFEGWIKHLPRW